MKARILPLLLMMLALLWSAPVLAQGTLRIGIAEDPDTLDPATNRTAAGRQPLTAFCDKLFDVTTKLELVPMLATGYEIAPDGPVGDADAPPERHLPRWRALRRRGGALQP